MRIKLDGKRYKMLISDIPHNGDCDDPKTIHKKIRIKKGLKGLPLLDTIIHELLHACVWMADEDWVADNSTGIARALWRLGYRRQDSKSCSIKEEVQEPSEMVKETGQRQES